MKAKDCKIGTPVICWYNFNPRDTKIKPILTYIIESPHIDALEKKELCSVEALPGYVKIESLEEVSPETLANAKTKGLFENFGNLPEGCKVLFEYEIAHADVLKFCQMYRDYRLAVDMYKSSLILSDRPNTESEKVAVEMEIALDIEVQQWLQKNEDKVFYELYPEEPKKQYYFDIIKALNGSNKLHLAISNLAFKYNHRLYDDLDGLKDALEKGLHELNEAYPKCTPERFLYAPPREFSYAPYIELGNIIQIQLKPVRREVSDEC